MQGVDGQDTDAVVEFTAQWRGPSGTCVHCIWRSEVQFLWHHLGERGINMESLERRMIFVSENYEEEGGRK